MTADSQKRFDEKLEAITLHLQLSGNEVFIFLTCVLNHMAHISFTTEAEIERKRTITLVKRVLLLVQESAMLTNPQIDWIIGELRKMGISGV